MIVRATMDDVALKAGVSKGTVSRVLNRAPNVSRENILAVKSAAAQVGYPMDGTLSRRRRKEGPQAGAAPATTRVGLMLVGTRSLKWILDNAPVYSYVIHGVEQTFAERGVDLVVGRVPDCAAVGDHIAQSRLDGLIFFGWEPKDTQPYEPLPVPAVWAMGQTMHFTGDHLLPDNIRAGVLAGQFLAGHRHAAFLGTDVVGVSYDGVRRPHRGAAFVELRAAQGLRTLQLVDPELKQADSNHPDERRLSDLIDRFVAAEPRPTGIFVEMDAYTPGVYRQLLARGIKPGADVSIVTCNNERTWVAGLHPAPAIIDIHADVIGRLAAERLLFRIRNPAAHAQQVMLRPTLIVPAPAPETQIA